MTQRHENVIKQLFSLSLPLVASFSELLFYVICYNVLFLFLQIKQNVLAIALTIAFAVSGVRGERWSRQVTNSEWIPLAAPRTESQVQGQEQNLETEGVNGLTTAADRHSLSRIQPIALPPELQQQYQEQLLQLQRTQESIEKLLHLQQQLKDQQRLLKVI